MPENNRNVIFTSEAQEYLKRLELEDDQFSIKFSTEVNFYDLDSDSEERFDRFYAKYAICDLPKSEIGNVAFHAINAEKMHVSIIREIADSIEFQLYQSLSSVRIFSNKEHAKLEKYFGYKNFYEEETTDFILGMKDKMKVIMQHGLAPYSEGFEQYTFEDKSYHQNTIDVWGKVLVLDDIEFYALFNKPFLTKPLITQLLDSIKHIGYFDWLIINPNIDSEYIVSKNYPASSTEEYKNLLEKLGFVKSYGKLHDNQFCYCMNLIDQEKFKGLK